MKPKLKPPGTRRLKLKCDILLSTSGFNFNLRRYTAALKIIDFGGGGELTDRAKLHHRLLLQAGAGGVLSVSRLLIVYSCSNAFAV